MKKIGRFTITGLLGKGGMGKVYKVTYPVTGKVAALKLLDPSSLLAALTDEKALEAIFTKEAITMASIRHPHVVDILDFGKAEGRLYYIMDFFCNNLSTLMGESAEADQTRIIPIDKAVHYTTQTLKGLSCLHFFHIIHRDIKPANILITDQDTVKICDFGLSKHRGEKQKRHGSIRVGSPFYAAPEQEKAPDHVDITADLYSVGVMLYKMLSGHLPDGNHPVVSHINPDLDYTWDRFLVQAMHQDPAKRYQDADTMARHLQDMLRSWEGKKEKICAMSAFPEQDTDISGRPGTVDSLLKQTRPKAVRSKPEKIPLKKAQRFFGLNRFMQPCEYEPNDFILSENGVVTDRHTGLMWQQSGTGFPVTWHQAKEYVVRLNEQAFGGYTGWRLPTLHELLTLATPPVTGQDHCISPVFDMSQKWLWSSDKSTFVSAWYMSLEMRFVERNDLTGFYHAKAVCSVF